MTQTKSNQSINQINQIKPNQINQIKPNQINQSINSISPNQIKSNQSIVCNFVIQKNPFSQPPYQA